MTSMSHLLAALLVIFVFSQSLPLQAAEWQSYPYTDTYRRVCSLGDKLYILKGNTLVRADIGQWQIEQTLTREDGLSGTIISDIIYSPDANRLAIIYEDGLIDVVHPDGSFWTIPDLYNNPMAGFSKEIKSIREQQGQLYICTGFGFLIVDLNKEVILHTINLEKSIHCAWAYNGDWYYSDDAGTFYCPQSSNPYNPGNWKQACDHIIMQAIVLQGAGYEQCWQVGKDKSLRKIVGPSRACARCSGTGSTRSISRAGHYIMAFGTDSLSLYDVNLGHCPSFGKAPKEGQRRVCMTPGYLTVTDFCELQSDSLQFAFLFPSGGIEASTLHCYEDYKFSIQQRHPSRLTITNHQQSAAINRLCFDGTNQIGMSYVAATVTGYSYQIKQQGYLTTCNTNNHVWNNYPSSLVSDQIGRFVGLLDFAADPVHPQRYWYSTLEDGIIGIDHGKFYTRYNKSNTNSGLENFTSGCTRVAGLAVSPEGDLWCCNDGVTNILRVRKESTGKWYSFQITGLEKSLGFTHMLHTRHNGRHQIWACQEHTYANSAVFAYDYGADIEHKDDDRFATFKSFIPDQGAPFVPYYGRGIYEGPDGAIWLFNTSGLYVIDEPDSVFTHPGQMRAVMTDVVPTSMATDNQQRLWVATEGHGLYLLSSDGRKEFAHINAGNSLLSSNEVHSLAFDSIHSTLWIALKGQILSYTYDADEYGSSDAWTSSAWCYPGFVSTGSLNSINVFGLKEGSTVTIENSQGRTLDTGTALGEQASFDVSSYPIGTYSIKGSDVEGHRGVLCSFDVE